jgi:alpha-L-rhamnosidase
MYEMACLTEHRARSAESYGQLFRDLRRSFQRQHLRPDGMLDVDTQTAYVLALSIGLLPEERVSPAAARLADKIAKNGFRMATGFLGTKPLLPVLTASGQDDLAVRLFQSRKFPSWGYEVEQGATTVWERWDSFTKEHGFNGSGGNQNASMNSFSHYSFGAVMQWAYQALAGIDTDGAGFQRILIKPMPPAPGSNPDAKPINWVKAEYRSARGKIVSGWKRDGDRFDLNVAIPANTTATVFVPAKSADAVTEGGQSLSKTKGVKFLRIGRCSVSVPASSDSGPGSDPTNSKLNCRKGTPRGTAATNGNDR